MLHSGTGTEALVLREYLQGYDGEWTD